MRQQKNKRILEIIKILKNDYPHSQCNLIHKTPFELLVATILSAQCTDQRVNLVTPDLFKLFPTPFELARAPVPKIEGMIASINFFRSKAHSIKSTAQILVSQYKGEVPPQLEKLIQLRGVGRKTANVVLGVCFQIPSLVVDTHVKRLSYRLGLTKYKDPEKIEQDLIRIIPQEDWTLFGSLLIDHGRKTCTARRADCGSCTLAHLCPKQGFKQSVSVEHG